MKKGFKKTGIGLSLVAAGVLVSGIAQPKEDQISLGQDMRESVVRIDPEVASEIDETRGQMNNALLAQNTVPKKFSVLQVYIDRKDEVTIKTLRSYDQKLRSQIVETGKKSQENVESYRRSLLGQLSAAFDSHKGAIAGYKQKLNEAKDNSSAFTESFSQYATHVTKQFKGYGLEQKDDLKKYCDDQNSYLDAIIDSHSASFNSYLEKLRVDFELSVRREAAKTPGSDPGELEQFVIRKIDAFGAFLEDRRKNFQQVLDVHVDAFAAYCSDQNTAHENDAGAKVTELETYWKGL